MPFNVVPYYHDIYSREEPSLTEILGNIPRKKIIEICAFANAFLLFKGTNSQQVQHELLTFFISKHSLENQRKVTYAFKKFDKRGDSVAYFSLLYCNSLIEWAILNLSDDSRAGYNEEVLYTQTLEALIFIADVENQKVSAAVSSATSLNEAMWPISIAQSEARSLISPTLEIIKLLLLLEHLKESDHDGRLSEYLGAFNCSNINEYIAHVIRIVKVPKAYKEGNAITPVIKVFESIKPVLEKLVVNSGTAQYSNQNEGDSFILKKYPLYKIDDDHYIVMNWNSFSLSIYNGVLFSLHDSIYREKYPEFITFKGYVSKQVSEEKLFRRIVIRLFSDKHTIIPNNSNLGDICIINGRKVFIFEYKDPLYPHSAATSFDYKTIESDVYKKFVQSDNGDSKGVYQLASAISTLSSTKEYNIRNLRVFPILIYSNHRYNLPRLCEYLNGFFESKLGNEVRDRFKHIYPVTSFDLQTLAEYTSEFNSKGLDSYIIGYHKRKKKESKFGVVGFERALRANPPFSVYMRQVGPKISGLNELINHLLE